jgi:hypothetical protein
MIGKAYDLTDLCLGFNRRWKLHDIFVITAIISMDRHAYTFVIIYLKNIYTGLRSNPLRQ